MIKTFSMAQESFTDLLILATAQLLAIIFILTGF
jgi:hypothetical protein